MKTQIKREGDTIIVHMDGILDFETSVPLREDLGKVLRQSKAQTSPARIVFNFENLEFVGSSGISAFVHALREFNSLAPSRPRYCNVKSEFKRVIKAFDENQAFEFHENEERAKRSFDQ